MWLEMAQSGKNEAISKRTLILAPYHALASMLILVVLGIR
jgi:hypothetical protein